ncbi:hypothetical protein CEXT_285181 [Caerostris extrusa]|uniref:Uncharacterized protein n=1 Tax=Caerostris extrusa TaxID=172846 RepID=A0AAV4V919_CAEEX|nr:hypothetical protein CEXT_285181 [Caerostris extrusa]
MAEDIVVSLVTAGSFSQPRVTNPVSALSARPCEKDGGLNAALSQASAQCLARTSSFARVDRMGRRS